MSPAYPISLAAGFLVTVLLLKVLQPVARRIGLVDVPTQRKQHHGEVPLTGGLAIFIGLCFALLTLDMPLAQYRAFVACAMILVIVGVLDDLHELSHIARFIAQALAAILMASWGGVMLEDFGQLLSGLFVLELGMFALPVTVFATVGVINALNMVDGVNGLSGSISLISVAGMIILALVAGDAQAARWLGLVAAVLMAFLCFNWRFGDRPAAAFMGDSGSMLVGFILAWSFIQLSQGESRVMSPVTALWLFAVPLVDTLTMMVRRVRKGQSPFAADCEHFHHMLLRAGMGKRSTTLLITSFAAISAGFGIFGHLYGVPEFVMFYLFLALFVGYFTVISHAWKTMRMLKRRIRPVI